MQETDVFVSLVQARQKLGTLPVESAVQLRGKRLGRHPQREQVLAKVGRVLARNRPHAAEVDTSMLWGDVVTSEPEVGMSFANVAAQTSRPSTEARFKKLMNAMVRITSTSPDTIDGELLFKPWETATASEQSVGSGLVVAQDPLIMVTNAHVVLDAFAVEVTLPALGRAKYDAQVRMISPDFDVALLKLTPTSERQLKQDADAAQFNITTLQIAERTPACPLGVPVLAVGFSLGSLTPKLSEGIISGGSNLNGGVECSSTAPISSGNSGGPLLFADDLTVGGLSYASYTDAQNLNLVVPGFRVRQLLAKLRLGEKQSLGWPLVSPSPSVGALSFLPSIPEPHVQVRIPSVDLRTTRGGEALRALTNCTNGIFVSTVPRTSVFTAAEPTLPEQFFLESVDSNAIDAYGQGRVPGYVEERVSFDEMLTLREDLTGNATVKICAGGRTSEHSLPLHWQRHFDGEVPLIYEVAFAPLDYELFAGIGFMELTLNHVESLVEAGIPTLARFVLPDFQESKHLFVSYVAPGCDDYDTLSKGMIVAKVNGQTVSSLDDFRSAFMPKDLDIFTIETDQQVLFTMNFTQHLHQQLVDARHGAGAEYLLTPAVRAAQKQLHL